MIKIVTKNLENKIISTITKPTLEEAQELFESEKAAGSFGRIAWDEPVFDETGKELEVIHHPDEFTFEIQDITEQHAFEQLMIQLEIKGEQHENSCHGCLRIIGGYNDQRQLTLEQIVAMANSFASIETLLNRRMPRTAKAAIMALVPDEILVTTELKNLLLARLTAAGF